MMATESWAHLGLRLVKAPVLESRWPGPQEQHIHRFQNGVRVRTRAKGTARLREGGAAGRIIRRETRCR